MKKSMLMLLALFMLGACSTKDDGVSVNSEFAKLVGGKTMDIGTFSADASEFVINESIATGTLKLTVSTADSATYEGTATMSGSSGSADISFKDVDEEGGTYSSTALSITDKEFTFLK